ncbi:O-antigen ligase family protein [Pigmentiphaga litoralis]|uniref:O-antigen ligase family protein n=1 Tax=Pigmentiphaga litoralis TaxID=516702 RepID=UPI003B42EC2A
MTNYRQFSTLPLLGWFMFTALVMNNDALFLKIGSFNLSPWDAIFLAIVAVKFARLAEPTAYALPSARIGFLLALQLIALLFVVMMQFRHTNTIETGDAVRDFRVLIYFLSIPFLCYKDLQSHDNYMTLQRFFIWSGMAVAAWIAVEQLFVFSASNPVRNLRIGVWVIPFSIVSVLYFQEQLGIKKRTAYMMTLFMLAALVFSLNRSQYLQLGVAIGIAALLGGRVGAMRKSIVYFVPALIGVLALFYAIGYADVLIDRIISVNDLESDSSYGARIQELEGQVQLYQQAPILGQGAGFKSWVMGENGFELSTFAHNSWMFYLMKFGIVGTVLVFLPAVFVLLMSMLPSYRDAQLELHRRYILATVPIYLIVDPLSGGLAYAPKTAFVGVLLTYCLSLIRNAHRETTPQPVHYYTPEGVPHHG